MGYGLNARDSKLISAPGSALPYRCSTMPTPSIGRDFRAREGGAGDPPQAPGRIEIALSGGRRVCVTAPVDGQALADVLAALEGRPC